MLRKTPIPLPHMDEQKSIVWEILAKESADKLSVIGEESFERRYQRLGREMT